MIWIIKQRPNKEPKFHQAEILDGAGKSTNALLAILNNGWLRRKGLFISLRKVVKALGKY